MNALEEALSGTLQQVLQESVGNIIRFVQENSLHLGRTTVPPTSCGLC
jgi:hypothetical protein